MPDDVKPDDTTTSEAPVEDITKAETYAAFEKLRQQAEAGSTAVPPVKRDDTDAPPDETGEESIEDSDDGSADAGSRKAAKKTDQLPAGVKKRLERERRKAAAAEKKAAEWQRKYEEALSAAKPLPTDPDDSDDGDDYEEAYDGDNPMPQSLFDDRYDYPDEADYGTDTSEGLSAYLDDVDRWERRVPLEGGKYAKGKKAAKADAGAQEDKPGAGADPEPSETAPIDGDEPSADQIVDQQFKDLHEALEEAEGTDDDLATEFFEQLEADKFRLSPEMLEWLADHDDAAQVAAQFVKSPRKANRIFRAPKSKHAQLLAELAAGDGEESSPTRATDNRDGKPVVDDFNGRRPRDPSKRLAGAKDFNTYADLRDDMGGPTGRSRSAA